jgi:hypothetical protein
MGMAVIVVSQMSGVKVVGRGKRQSSMYLRAS